MNAQRNQAAETARAKAPMLLAPNRIERFYPGGPRISELRGPGDDGRPGSEDWVGSTTTSLRQDHEGLSRLADGRLLRDAVQADPIGFLGAEHVARWGANPALLTKLLDAGDRLPVHFHPGRAFAAERLGLRFGKTEAWIIISAEPGAHMQLGFKETVDPSTAARWVAEQDVEEMLAALRDVPVAAGDALFVPAGTPHTIGQGILLIELQEPTDLSVVMEWSRFGVDTGAEHLYLGWEAILPALDLHGEPVGAGPVARDEAAPSPVRDIFPAFADPYFRAQEIVLDGESVTLEPSFSILIVLDGTLAVTGERSDGLELARGQTGLIPHHADETIMSGHARLIRCLPPAPDSGKGRW